MPQDARELEAFLAGHAASSMFLRGNLAAYGLDEVAHSHGTTYWLQENSKGITGVAGCTNGGNLMCQAPHAAPAFWAAVTQQMAGRRLAAITGVPAQTQSWCDALGWREADFARNQITPLYQVDMAEVTAPPVALGLRAPRPDDAAMLAGWFEGFHRDTGLVLPQSSSLQDAAAAFIARSDTRILMAQGAAVAMTALNARVRDAVQVGGVYVPPAYRGRGYGGAVVALHLRELARAGIALGVLFAANAAAAQAYERIGFRQVGDYRVAMLKAPLVVGAPHGV